MVMLSTNPSAAREWRLEDERATGRMRNTDIFAIAADQEMNIARFKMLYADSQLPNSSSVVENQSGRLDESLDEGFTFTREGVNWFSRYYFSELPYEKYKRKQVEEN